MEALSGACSVCHGSSFIQVAWLGVDGKAFKWSLVCYQVQKSQWWVPGLDTVCPLNEEEKDTQRKTWRRAEVSVLPVCFFL